MLQTAQIFEKIQANAIDRELCTKFQINYLKPRISSYKDQDHVRLAVLSYLGNYYVTT